MKSKKSLSHLLLLIYILIVLIIAFDLWFDLFQKKYFDKINNRSISNAIIVPVMIDGESYNFEFDTGAYTSHIKRAIH